MREQHAATAITFNAKAIQNFASVFALFHSLGKVFPLVTNQETAAEAADGNNHGSHIDIVLLGIMLTVN